MEGEGDVDKRNVNMAQRGPGPPPGTQGGPPVRHWVWVSEVLARKHQHQPWDPWCIEAERSALAEYLALAGIDVWYAELHEIT